MPAWISCYLGVTEPAIFGVNLKYFFPFICGMTGSACAAVVCVSTSTTANAIGVGGVPGILSIQPQYMPSFALSMVAAIVVPFILTVIVGKKKGVDKENVLEMASVDHVEGSVVPVQAAACEHELLAFLDSDGNCLGELSACVFCPVSARVAVLMEDSRHAVGLVLPDGVEILLHVGLDTVNMQGDGFEYLVKSGDEVQAGTPLLKFDREKIKKAGHEDVTVCIITNKNGVDSFAFKTGIQGKAGEMFLLFSLSLFP